MKDILLDAVIDLVKILPFLFGSFILMELVEHKLKNKNKLLGVKKYGPLIGALLGIVPQCGFSAVAANFYAARVISLGTLIAIFLSTSDEMVAIMIGNNVKLEVIIKILLIKLMIGLLFGFIIDLVYKRKERNVIEEMCNDAHCHCHDGVIKSSIIHTIKIGLFILLFNILLGFIIDKEVFVNFLSSSKFITPILASIIGLIPNCAASILVTEMYVSGVINIGSCISGLLAGSGVGILILFKQNKNISENIMITILLILIASMCGIIINII